jgi:hypothetical protein
MLEELIKVEEEITGSAVVKSIQTSIGMKPKTNSAVMSMLIRGVCVPVYCSVENIPLDYIPYDGERLLIEYEEIDYKITIKSYTRQSGKTYCKRLD